MEASQSLPSGGKHPEPDWKQIHQELQIHKNLTLQLVWQEGRESNPDGYAYSRFCDLYRRWLKKLDLVLRQEHRAGEKMFVDYAGATIPIHDPQSGDVHPAAVFVAVLGASSYTFAEATRLKDNAAFEVVEECQIPVDRNIRADQLIRLTGARAQIDYPELLRRIVVWDAENQREIVLLTNLLHFGSTTIAAIYEERWQIELFFKALKQNLTVKTFVGTSENALRIQIWTALIALLLPKWLHHLSKANWSLSNLASMLRLKLFTYRDLTKWLHEPMETPPLLPGAQQLTLALT